MDSEYSDDTVGEDGVNATEYQQQAPPSKLPWKDVPADAVVAVVSDGMLDEGTEEPSDDEEFPSIIDCKIVKVILEAVP